MKTENYKGALIDKGYVGFSWHSPDHVDIDFGQGHGMTVEECRTQIDEFFEDLKFESYKKEVRQAFADYLASEGCGCCGSATEHEKAEESLAKLLNPKKYEDGSGYNWGIYSTNPKEG